MDKKLLEYFEASLRVRRRHLNVIMDNSFDGDRTTALFGWVASVLDDESDELEMRGASEETVEALRDLASCFWHEFIDCAAHLGSDVMLIAEQNLGLRVIEGDKK